MTTTPRDGLDPRAVEAAAEAVRAEVQKFPAPSILGGQIGWGATPEEVATAALTAAAPFLRAEGAAAQAEVVVRRCPECDAGEPCQVVRDSDAIAPPETGDGAEDAPSPMRDEPAPSPDDPHGACSRNLVAVAVERDKARAAAAAASERHEDDLRRLLDCREVVRSLTAERDDARAAIARVTALWESEPGGWDDDDLIDIAAIRAAITGPTPTEGGAE